MIKHGRFTIATREVGNRTIAFVVRGYPVFAEAKTKDEAVAALKCKLDAADKRP